MSRESFWFSDQQDRVVTLDTFGDGTDAYDVHRVALQIDEMSQRGRQPRHRAVTLVELFLKTDFRNRYMDVMDENLFLVNREFMERSVWERAGRPRRPGSK